MPCSFIEQFHANISTTEIHKAILKHVSTLQFLSLFVLMFSADRRDPKKALDPVRAVPFLYPKPAVPERPLLPKPPVSAKPVLPIPSALTAEAVKLRAHTEDGKPGDSPAQVTAEH